MQTLSDNVEEVLFETFENCMIQQGILHQPSCVDTLSQNGIADRKKRHLLETVRALLFPNAGSKTI